MAAARLVAVTSASAERERLAWAALQDVPDPEVPVISVCELGIVREVHALPEGQGMEIVLTPTYSGCPATEVIERSVLEAIEAAGLGPARAVLRRAPQWLVARRSEGSPFADIVTGRINTQREQAWPCVGLVGLMGGRGSVRGLKWFQLCALRCFSPGRFDSLGGCGCFGGSTCPGRLGLVILEKRLWHKVEIAACP